MSFPARSVLLVITLFAVMALWPHPSGAQEVIEIRTGQAPPGVPGACGQIDQCFRFIDGNCNSPLRPGAFTQADFDAARLSANFARIVNPNPGWLPLLPDSCDSTMDARWINSQAHPCSLNLGGVGRSVLYACPFDVQTPCHPTATVCICWMVDDDLGDAINNRGVWIGPDNGTVLPTPLSAQFTGGGFTAATERCQFNVPVRTGRNWIYFYQRDLGCSASGLLAYVNITIPAPTSQSLAEITGVKFEDLDCDGMKDPGENLIGGWGIQLSPGPSTVTNATGAFQFTGLNPGTYMLTEITQPGWIQCLPSTGKYTINITNDDCDSTFFYCFGNRQCLPAGTCERPASSLVVWYPFDDCVGNAMAQDVVSNRDATWNGAPIWSSGWSGTPGDCAIDLTSLVGKWLMANSSSQVSFGGGSYGLFARIRTVNADGMIHTIVEKKGNFPNGYRLSIQTGSGAARLHFTYWVNSTPYTFVTGLLPLNNGAWHCVGVTVARILPNQNVLKLWVNGSSQATFTGAAVPNWSLNNPFPFIIGFSNSVGVPFAGHIDDLRVYKGRVSDSDAMMACNPQCREFCYVGDWTSSPAPNPAKFKAVRIYNYTNNPQMYAWTVAGVNPPAPPCTVPGPTSYTPNSGTAVVPGANSGKAMAEIGFGVSIPASWTSGSIGCYSVCVLNKTTGNCFCCEAQIRKTPVLAPKVNSPILSVFEGQQVGAEFVLQNTSTQSGLALNYRLDGRSSDGDSTNQVVSLSGLPPGTPVFGSFSIPPGDSTFITVPVQVLEYQPINMNEVLLSVDYDGDGDYEPTEIIGLDSFTEEQVSEAPPPVTDVPPIVENPLQAAPNPFHRATSIKFVLSDTEPEVEVGVFDVGGRLVRQLFAGRLDAGLHAYAWDGTTSEGMRSSSGIYFIRVQKRGDDLKTKIVLLD